MSSLAAARADNFYYPPGFDPNKHGSLNKYQGQHPLRDRARKLDKGILVIRFEVPFNIWCCQCGEHIAKGVRFNAEKQQVGSYHSTKILSFTMRHHCGCKITFQTDPKNAEYVVTAGAERKVEQYDAEDAQTLEIPDAQERAAIAADPLASLERTTLQRQAAAAGAKTLVALATDSEAKHRDDYALNRALRDGLRAKRKADAALDTKRRALGLSEEVKLLPEAEEDRQVAQLALFSAQGQKFSSNWASKRQKIMTESIFDGAPAPPGHSTHHRQQAQHTGRAAGHGTQHGQQAQQHQVRHKVRPVGGAGGTTAAAAGVGPGRPAKVPLPTGAAVPRGGGSSSSSRDGGGSGSGSSAKQLLQQRMLAAARRKAAGLL